MTDLASAALTVLLTISPLTAPREVLPGWQEAPEARRVRYESIAADVAAAAEAACGEAEPCRRWSVAVLLGIANHESGFAPDVDRGGCYRGPGYAARCDGGASVSMWQIRVGGEEGALYRTDRRAAAKQALHAATRSWNGCRKLEPALRFAIYAGGTCSNATAQIRSRELWAYIQRAMVAWPAEK